MCATPTEGRFQAASVSFNGVGTSGIVAASWRCAEPNDNRARPKLTPSGTALRPRESGSAVFSDSGCIQPGRVCLIKVSVDILQTAQGPRPNCPPGGGHHVPAPASLSCRRCCRQGRRSRRRCAPRAGVEPAVQRRDSLRRRGHAAPRRPSTPIFSAEPPRPRRRLTLARHQLESCTTYRATRPGQRKVVLK